MTAPRAQSSRPRIIFVNRYFAPDLSATSQMLTDLTRRLAEKDFEVEVVCSRQRYDDNATEPCGPPPRFHPGQRGEHDEQTVDDQKRN